MTIGSGVLIAPGLTVLNMGGWAPLAVIATALGVTLIQLTFAEAAGRYRDQGGPYRYAGDAFGEYVGVQVGLLYWVVRVTSTAAIANVFVTYFGHLWSPAAEPGWSRALLTLTILGSGWVNIRGTRGSASLLNVLAFAKVAPLVFLGVAGLFAISPGKLIATPLPDSTAWARAIFLWVFTFGGFEAALIPAGEARDPVRHGPRALLYALAIVAFVYLAVQLVVAGTLVGEISNRPVSQAAQIVLGHWGALLIVLGALASTSGAMAGSIFAASRITFAIAERGGLPMVLARVQPKYKTPDSSILLFTLSAWVLALTSGFVWNAMISAIARLVVYAVCALAVLKLRQHGPSSFQVPAWVHLGAVAFCGWLLMYQTRDEAAALLAVLLGTSLLWWGRRCWQPR